MEASGYGWHTEVASGGLLFRLEAMDRWRILHIATGAITLTWPLCCMATLVCNLI